MTSTRDRYLIRIYGITEDQYNEILQRQGGHCAICPKKVERNGRRLAVDHDHHTGEIRGILCQFCNQRLIGRHRSPTLFYAAGKYLDGPYTGLIVPKKRPKKRRRKKRKHGR